jgi:hypothetical protein
MYRASGDTAIDIGKLFNRRGVPGTGRTICLLVGKSIACPNAATDPGTITNSITIRLKTFIVTPYQLRLSVALQKFYGSCYHFRGALQKSYTTTQTPLLALEIAV